MGSRIRAFVNAALLLSLISLAHAQGGSVSGQVFFPPPPTSSGLPAPFSTIRICTATATGTPCSPLIPGVPSGSGVFLDPGLTIGTTNPSSTDQNGMYALWVSAQPVLVQITPIAGTTYSQLVEAGNGTVTSVGLSMPTNVFTVASSPITNFGTLGVTFISQPANQVLASPNGGPGTPIFRSIVPTDFGAQSANQVLGNCTSASANPTFCALNAAMIPGTLNATNFSGNVGITGNLTTTGTGIIGGNLTVNGSATTLNTTLAVSGAAAITGNTTVGGTLGVTGSTTAPIFNATTGIEIGGSFGTTGYVLTSTGSGSAYAAPIQVSSYNSGGTPQGTITQIVFYSGTLGAGSTFITFTGSAVFPHANISCTANDGAAANAVQVISQSTTGVTVAGTNGNGVTGVCFGN